MKTLNNLMRRLGWVRIAQENFWKEKYSEEIGKAISVSKELSLAKDKLISAQSEISFLKAMMTALNGDAGIPTGQWIGRGEPVKGTPQKKRKKHAKP